MGVTKTCKALRFVPVTEILDSAEVTEKLENLLGLSEITEPHILGLHHGNFASKSALN